MKKLIVRIKGGSGSGNYGHAGRPGLVGGSGGSGSGGGGSAISLSPEEKQAVHGYTWLMSETINAELRSGDLSTSKAFGTLMSRAEQVQHLDSAIDKAPPAPSDFVVHSKIDAVHIHRAGDLREGATVHNLGYMSMSTREGGVSSHPGVRRAVSAVLNLHVQKGTRGVLDVQSLSHYPQEKELLIARGSSYKIIGITQPANSYIDPVIIDAELL